MDTQSKPKLQTCTAHAPPGIYLSGLSQTTFVTKIRPLKHVLFASKSQPPCTLFDLKARHGTARTRAGMARRGKLRPGRALMLKGSLTLTSEHSISLTDIEIHHAQALMSRLVTRYVCYATAGESESRNARILRRLAWIPLKS
jgi:hypothetical protein